MNDLLEYEKELYKKGLNFIAGIDEVGRGPLCGPVVACACILPINYQLDGLNDSKKISEKKREELYEILIKDALSYGIGIISPKRIDEINILEATKEAMKEAVNNLDIKPEYHTMRQYHCLLYLLWEAETAQSFPIPGVLIPVFSCICPSFLLFLSFPSCRSPLSCQYVSF